MPLTYDGTDGLFTRLGTLIYFANQVSLHQANLLAYLANTQLEYSSSDSYMIDIVNGQIEARRVEAAGVLSDIRASAEKTLVEMCWAQAKASTVNPMPSQDLQSALLWLIRQMDIDGETVEQSISSVSSSGAKAGNNGNGAFPYSLTPSYALTSTGSLLPYVRKDILEARCVADAQSGAIAPGSERLMISGSRSYPWSSSDFPGGSGARFEITSICASVDDGIRGQNILTNSDLEDWTTNLPDAFTVSSGTAGNEFLRESTTVARGTYGMKMAVTGNTFKIRQQLGSSTGTLGRLIPDTCYVISAMVRKDASATGTVRVALEDSSGTAITNAEASWTVSTFSSSAWTTLTLTFRTPKILPSTTYLAIGTTSAIATAAAYIDEICVAEMTQLAPGGQCIAVVSGTKDWVVGDQVYQVFTNDYAGGFLQGFDKLFDMAARDLRLPSAVSGAETILDSLIA